MSSKGLRKERESQPKNWYRERNGRDQAVTNEMEVKIHCKESVKQRVGFFERINNVGKPLAEGHQNK